MREIPLNFAVKDTGPEAPPAKRFMAWCARWPDLGSGPLDVPGDIETWFAFGASEEEALRAVKAEVFQ